MKNLKTAVALACAVAATAAAGRAADVDDATQKTLTANYALACTAASNPSDANLDAAFANLAPDFVNVDPTGKQESRDQVVSLGKQQLKMLHATACSNKIDSISATDPNTIVVVNTLHLEGDVTTPDGKHALILTDKAQDTWKNVGGKWMEGQSKDLHVLVQIDGNVVQDLGS
ncbi:MAG TPA: hypothetical protein VIJ77_01540 [Candidatus Tumulicola sp.]